MKKISLVIGDQDMDYIELLANYIRNTDYSSRFDLKLFSEPEHLQSYLSSDQKTNILLVTQELLPEEKNEEQIDYVITLVDHNETAADPSQIFKYQSLDNLLSTIISNYYERHGKKEKKKSSETRTKIISLFSATGGTGKTTVAYNLARELSAEDYQVFYLNLELIHSTSIIFDTEGIETVAPLLYYIKTNADQLLSKIESFITIDNKTGIHYLNLPVSAEEMQDISSEDLELLINSLVKLGDYHYIVVDLESSLNHRVLTALGKSDHVLWLLNNDIQSFYKTNYLLEEMHAFLKDGSFRDRVTLILNRYTGSMNEQLTEYGVQVDMRLPYVPDWKEVGSGEQLASIPIFNKAIIELYQNFLKMEQVEEVKRGMLNG